LISKPLVQRVARIKTCTCTQSEPRGFRLGLPSRAIPQPINPRAPHASTNTQSPCRKGQAVVELMSLLHNPPVAGNSHSQHAQTVAAAAADARESAAARLSEYNNPPIITSMLSCSSCPKAEGS
jgi:hypothetical protein